MNWSKGRWPSHLTWVKTSASGKKTSEYATPRATSQFQRRMARERSRKINPRAWNERQPICTPTASVRARISPAVQ